MIDTKALKQKILDLAMRGKLVPQDPNDEPVEELLARIREERRKLEKEKKISKVEESDIYWSDDDNCYYEKNDIPTGWSCLQLQYFSHIYTGNSLNEKQKNDLSIKLNYFYHYIATKDIDLSGNINYENGLYIPLYYNLKKAKQNSILICLEGANAGNKIGLTKEEVCFVNKLACVSPFILMSKYVYYFFNSVTFNNEFRDNMQGIIGGIPLSKFKTLSILIPPLQEQERIVNKIDELFRLVDKIERDQQELEELKKQAKDKVLELAVTGKLVKQDPNDEPASVLLGRIKAEKEKLIKEGKIKREKADLEPISDDDKNYYENIPSTWIITTLNNICSKIVDGNHNPPKGSQKKTNYYMLSSQNIINDDIAELNKARFLTKEQFFEENKRTKLSINDILFTSVGSIGRSCVYNYNYNLCFQRSVSVITTLINPYYIKLFLDAPMQQALFNQKASGTAQKGFYLNQLSNLYIAVPPITEQSKIVKKYNIIVSYLII